MVKQVKQAKADIYLRDTDSQSLFNNSGELSFKYFHEWNDCYNPTTGKTAQIDGETYDEETNSYKPNCPEGYIPVFNGRQSALWDNMVSCFPDKIQDMYKTMRNNGLSYNDMFAKYKEFWKLWCENLYNADAFGYANTGNFEKAFGDKLQMMNFFFYKRQRYLDSKYCCGSSVSNTLRLRLSETGKGLALKYYQALYSSLQWGIGSFATQRNIDPGTYTYQPWGIKNPQDATFDIDDADLITELSTYVKASDGSYTITGLEGIGNFKFDSSMSILKRLTKFIMNYTTAKPNTNELGKFFDLSGMTMLKQVIVRNVKNLTNSIVINSDIVEEIDFTNTPIVGITTPPSDSLTKLVLPDTIVSLKLNGYSKLGFVNLAGYSNIDEFEIEDCPLIDSFTLLKACYDAGAPLTQVKLKDVGWQVSTNEDLEFLLYLARNNANITGKVAISKDILVSFNTKVVLMAAFGNIDDPTNSMYITYQVNTVSSITLLAKTYLTETGRYTIDILANPGNGNDVSDFVWSISDNKWATITQDGTLILNSVSNRAEGGKATVTLQASNTAGEVMESTKEFFFYKREAELGDYVFNDGTYAKELDDNPNAIVVATIFYLQPKDGYGKRHRAIAIANDYLNMYRGLTFYPQWGLTPSTFPGLNIIGVNDPYNIDGEGITTYPSNSVSKLTNVTTILDLSNEDNDYFKDYTNTPYYTWLGDIGFKTITEGIYNDLKTYLDDLDLGIGQYIATGQLNTLYIIKHRDQILSSTSVNLPIPKGDSNTTELSNLEFLVKSLVIKNNSNQSYAQYYYMGVSKDYSFELNAHGIKADVHSSLGLHHWFTPSVGELSRYLFYRYLKGTTDSIDEAIMTRFNIFKDNINDKDPGLLIPNASSTASTVGLFTCVYRGVSNSSNPNVNNVLWTNKNQGLHTSKPCVMIDIDE